MTTNTYCSLIIGLLVMTGLRAMDPTDLTTKEGVLSWAAMEDIDMTPAEAQELASNQRAQIENRANPVVEETKPADNVGMETKAANNSNNEREKCYLCLDELDATPVNISTNCPHQVCKDCYPEFLRSKATECGICRQAIVKPEPVRPTRSNPRRNALLAGRFARGYRGRRGITVPSQVRNQSIVQNAPRVQSRPVVRPTRSTPQRNAQIVVRLARRKRQRGITVLSQVGNQSTVQNAPRVQSRPVVRPIRSNSRRNAQLVACLARRNGQRGITVPSQVRNQSTVQNASQSQPIRQGFSRRGRNMLGRTSRLLLTLYEAGTIDQETYEQLYKYAKEGDMISFRSFLRIVLK